MTIHQILLATLASAGLTMLLALIFRLLIAYDKHTGIEPNRAVRTTEENLIVFTNAVFRLALLAGYAAALGCTWIEATAW